MKHPKTITLGELRHDLTQLLAMPDDTEVYFGAGDLSYNKINNHSPRDSQASRLMQVDFNQIYKVSVDLDADSNW